MSDVPPRLLGAIAAASISLCACAGAAPPPGAAAAAGATVVQCAGGDGDAAAVNGAIEGSAEGAEIIFAGQCLLSSTVVLRGNRSYRGTSKTGTVLRQADGANLPALLASDSYTNNEPTTGQPVTVRDMTLDGNRANNESSGTDGLVLRSWKSTVEDLNINGSGGSGIRVTNESADGTPIESTQVNGRISNNFITDSGRHGVYVEDSGNGVTDWQLGGNWIADSALDGIRIDNAAGWIVDRNHVYGVGNNGIWADRLFGSTLSDNYVEGFGEGETGTWYGVGVQVNGGAASTVTHNRVFALQGEKAGSTYRYIGVARVNYGVGLLAITGNTVRGVVGGQGVGLYYSSAGGAGLEVTSIGNAVSDVAQQRTVEPNVVLSPGF
jgi:hypothetical protein